MRYHNRIDSIRIELERFFIFIVAFIAPLPDAAFEQDSPARRFDQVTGTCYLLCRTVKS